VLDGEIGDATPRIEAVRRGKGGGRADVEAGSAMPAMIGLRRVRRQIERGKDRAQKQPGAELARHQIGMLALPAKGGSGGERLFHDRRGIDEDFHVAARTINEPAPDLLEPRFDQVVIIVAARVD
jgi:hypothetical protein